MYSQRILFYRSTFVPKLLRQSFQGFETDASKSESTIHSSDEVNTPANSYPLITARTLAKSAYCSPGRQPRQAWLETLKPGPHVPSLHPPVGMVDLHPDVFAATPRLDLVHQNLHWQAHYRMTDWRCITTRAELPYRSRRKPWPQKGTGRARHGNRRTHLWVGGGQCKGPRGPESYFFTLPFEVRLAGLLTMLSVKHTQNDLHIVDNFDLSEALEQQAKEVALEAAVAALEDLEFDDPLSAGARTHALRLSKAMNESAIYLRQLVNERRWGPSVLFVTDVALDPALWLANKTEQNYPNLDNISDLAITLGCSAYANFVEAELTPEAVLHQTEAVCPRATHPGRGLTLMPLHGLNVWSLVQHNTVVFTLNALDRLEERLLRAQRTIVRPDFVSWTPPAPADCLVAVEDELTRESDEDKLTYRGRRHFSGPIGSYYWKRVTVS
ncbi:hypothetical protein CRM22_010951 [Opisthorchis felineus]|uniref:Large ribosomal subunit protein uL4m n=2 Tax=Opisthorchis felineus TaxID=147828 RepID=A0A4S2KLG3_OPIFE|nr:hypothetical protein CRM22_010951 [Opisthorchis felineus]TGZ48829.1 hypothetical protein CRM22_010951 [Opisthorchis felineus]